LLASGAARVVAIERDSRCLEVLAEISAHWPGRLEAIADDALAVDFAALAARYPAPRRVCANLPYNIATPLLVGWLETEPWPPWFDRLTLMFQREVAERIVATPAQRADYGRLGVLANWRCETRILFDVPPAAFTPPPKVTSSVVELIPHPNPVPCRAATLSALTLAAFGQRRKMLRQSLKGFAADRALDLAQWLGEAGLAPTARAEELRVSDFAALAASADRGAP
jgi:16S rRNA (adenine1518-N6/adenine1519-N6)-dimethyltransferase